MSVFANPSAFFPTTNIWVEFCSKIWARPVVQAEAWVRFQASTCEICGRQSGTGIGFYVEYFGWCLSLSTSAVCRLLPLPLSYIVTGCFVVVKGVKDC